MTLTLIFGIWLSVDRIILLWPSSDNLCSVRYRQEIFIEPKTLLINHPCSEVAAEINKVTK